MIGVPIIILLFLAVWFNSTEDYRTITINAEVIYKGTKDLANVRNQVVIGATRPEYVNYTYFTREGTSADVNVTILGNAVVATLPFTLHPGQSFQIAVSGIGLRHGIDVINHNWNVPFVMNSSPYNSTATLNGVIICRTAAGNIPCEGYTIYYGYQNYGQADYRALTQSVDLVFFALTGALVASAVVCGYDRRWIRRIPFMTLGILTLTTFLYVYTDQGVYQASIAKLPVWVLPYYVFSHSGFNHFVGNLIPFLLVSTGVEIVSKTNERWKFFLILYFVPFAIYYLTGLVGGYGLSTLVGALSSGTYGYLFISARKHQQNFSNPLLLLVSVLAGLAGAGVILDYLLKVTVFYPFATSYDTDEAFWHLFVAVLAGVFVAKLSTKASNDVIEKQSQSAANSNMS